jgi:hypothetical protein
LARRNPAGCFMGGPKRRKQPKRYAKLRLKFFENIIQKIIGEIILK